MSASGEIAERCHYVKARFSTDTRKASQPCERAAVEGDHFCARHADTEQAVEWRAASGSDGQTDGG